MDERSERTVAKTEGNINVRKPLNISDTHLAVFSLISFFIIHCTTPCKEIHPEQELIYVKLL